MVRWWLGVVYCTGTKLPVGFAWVHGLGAGTGTEILTHNCTCTRQLYLSLTFVPITQRKRRSKITLPWHQPNLKSLPPCKSPLLLQKHITKIFSKAVAKKAPAQTKSKAVTVTESDDEESIFPSTQTKSKAPGVEESDEENTSRQGESPHTVDTIMTCDGEDEPEDEDSQLSKLFRISKYITYKNLIHRMAQQGLDSAYLCFLQTQSHGGLPPWLPFAYVPLLGCSVQT